MLRLAITADDFGYCSERNVGIMRAFGAGLVTDACLIAGFAASTEAVALATEAGLPLGLHLNITEGRPISPASSIPSLVQKPSSCVHETGRGAAAAACDCAPPEFLGKFGFFDAVDRGDVDAEDVRTEVRAQFSWFAREVGYSPYHVAGHNHVHVHPWVARVMAPLFVLAGSIPVRWSLACADELSILEEWPERPRLFLQRIAEYSAESTRIFDDAGLMRNSAFMGLALTGCHATLPRVRDTLRVLARDLRLKEDHNESANDAEETQFFSFCEYMAHPGLPQVSEGGDEFSRSADREHELELLSSDGLRDIIQETGFQLTSWRDAFRQPNLANKT